MAVTKVATGTGNRATGTSASLAVTATSPNLASSGSDVCAIVAVNISVSTNSTSTTCAVTYGGNAMTQIGSILLGGSSTNRAAAALYYLFNPPTGAQDVVATSGGTSTKVAIAAQTIVFSGVDSVGSLQTATATTHAPTSAVDGYDVRVLSNGAALSSPNQTNEYNAGTSVSGVGDYIQVQSAAGTGSTISFTCSGTATTPLSCAVALSPPAPLVGTLTDDFTTQDDAKWNYSAGASVSGGQLVQPADASYTGMIISDVTYDLTGSSAVVKLVQRANAGTGTIETLFILSDTNSPRTAPNLFGFDLYGTNLAAYNKVASAYDEIGTTYNSSTHAWLRIRHSGGTVYWDTSPDGTNWTNQRSITPAIPITALYVSLLAGYYGTEPTPGTAIWDNFNTPPTGAAPIITERALTVAVQRSNTY